MSNSGNLKAALAGLGLAAAIATFMAPGAAVAGTIGPFGCGNGSCMGVKYDLDNLGNQDGGSVLNDIWRIKLTADTTQYTGSALHWISGVSVKVFSGGGDITAVNLFSTTALGGAWNPAAEGKVNPTCASSPANGGVCADTLSQLTLADGSTYEWIFDITTVEGTGFTAMPSIQVQYLGINPNNNMVQNQGITSEEITLNGETMEMSEPATLAIVGLGLVGIGLTRRSRKMA